MVWNTRKHASLTLKESYDLRVGAAHQESDVVGFMVIRVKIVLKLTV